MAGDRQDTFQILTVLMVVLIAFVCMGMALIFINPQIAINPFKPPAAIAQSQATPTSGSGFALPPTWTPTPTETPTPTNTPTATPTQTLTPTPTSTPTVTPPPTVTPLPPTATRRPPTRTPLPPTVPPSPYSYRTAIKECKHSGGTFIEGTVFRVDPGDPESNARVALGSEPGNASSTLTTGNQGVSSGYYVHVLNANGSKPGTFFVWVVDGNGNPLSDPNAGRVVTNSIRNPDDPSACWRAVVDFARR